MARAIAAFSLPVFGLLLSTFAPCAWSLEVTAAVQATSEYTTNTARTEDNEIEEWIHQPGINIGANHAGAAVTFEGIGGFTVDISVTPKTIPTVSSLVVIESGNKFVSLAWYYGVNDGGSIIT